ncbi:cytochrome bc1 complex diheme cytochrome c subunit [Aciditerrimonas ferrireducens]|uniref:cytochrome bc1 complex diheme cytochrome c subunit n=1 Tax=Aciditerrimonas ferrireducens TaxID=667306 RepID=UPI002003652E|nr:c-type cytochrome [Aciditerrimonas ferrireducens]MCK4176905.1 c-type cytochrome [Aciditerrimonas ferrireducens]
MRRPHLRSLLPAGVVALAAVGGLAFSLTAGAVGRSTSVQTAADSLTPPPIHYVTHFTTGQVKEGEVLFEANCSTCHGTRAEGSAVAPDLQGLGPATVDFWVSTGRMPLADSSAQATDIAAFVASLAPTAPSYPDGIPYVNTKDANLQLGMRLFVLNCAACHTITGAGDALADGAYAPSLHRATSTQVAEAIRTGPGNMPVFGPGTLSNRQVADIVAYVTGVIQHPDDRGGLGLGGIGPVAEGFVALLFGVGGLMVVAFWLGERA